MIRNRFGSKEEIGLIKNMPVWLLKTLGGLNLVVTVNGSKVDILGAGPHPGIAKYVAGKRFSDIKFHDLNKTFDPLIKSEPTESVTMDILAQPWIDALNKL